MEYSEALLTIQSKPLYIQVDPESLDFMNSKKSQLVICADNVKLTFPIPTGKELFPFLGILNSFVSTSPLIIAWNLKYLLSFVYNHTKKDLIFENKIFDLKLMEHYMGETNSAPKTFTEAVARLKNVKAYRNFDMLMNIYNHITYPLMSKIIPRMENVDLVNIESKSKIYSCYEIEGQANGRLKCYKQTPFHYNPHSLSKEEKAKIRSCNYNESFIYLDFSSFEVYILQWLSKDSNLFKILNQKDKNVYELIWEEITGLPGEGKRKICKDIFLPVVYGQGAKSISEKLNINLETAKKLIDNINKKFFEAMSWIESQQKQFDLTAIDYYGRLRKFEQNYIVRNFLIQSPASTICLHKLVKLFNELPEAKLVFSLHDGYCLLTNQMEASRVTEKAIQILESYDDILYPNLNLKISCKIAPNLYDLE